jgi:hypothetical protein
MPEPTLLPRKMLMCTNNCVQYNKIKTTTNDPQITKPMRFAQLVNNYTYVTKMAPTRNIYKYKTPLFTNYHSK